MTEVRLSCNPTDRALQKVRWECEGLFCWLLGWLNKLRSWTEVPKKVTDLKTEGTLKLLNMEDGDEIDVITQQAGGRVDGGAAHWKALAGIIRTDSDSTNRLHTHGSNEQIAQPERFKAKKPIWMTDQLFRDFMTSYTNGTNTASNIHG
jgi:hypothetical protein